MDRKNVDAVAKGAMNTGRLLYSSWVVNDSANDYSLLNDYLNVAKRSWLGYEREVVIGAIEMAAHALDRRTAKKIYKYHFVPESSNVHRNIVETRKHEAALAQKAALARKDGAVLYERFVQLPQHFHEAHYFDDVLLGWFEPWPGNEKDVLTGFMEAAARSNDVAVRNYFN